MVSDHPKKTSRAFQAIDVSGCLTKQADVSGLVECLTQKTSCPYLISFGAYRFCNHPDKMQFVAVKNQTDSDGLTKRP